jgi:MoxR-like ATPase
MARIPNREPVYIAGDRFLTECLSGTGSLTWGSAKPWNRAALEEVWTRFAENPDTSSRKFYEKLKDQLEGASPDAMRVVVDILAFYYLYSSSITRETKLTKIREAADFLGLASELDLKIVDAAFVAGGIGNPGTYYNTGQPWNFSYLLSLGLETVGIPTARFDVSSLEALADAAMARIDPSTSLMRNVALHLMLPDSFERIGTNKHKTLVLEAFSRLDPRTGSLDSRLREVRRGLGAELGRPEFDFYEKDIASQWMKNEAEPPTPTPGSTPSPSRRCWIEKTHVAGRPDRQQGENALGQALWSPQRSGNGADIYRTMRDVAGGDVVLHLTDNEGFTGVSIAAGKADEAFRGVPGTEWADRASYRIPLRDYAPMTPPLSRTVFFSTPFKEQLLAYLDQGGSNLFYNSEPSLNQGKYLTLAPPELLAILNSAYMTVAGRQLVNQETPASYTLAQAAASSEGADLSAVCASFAKAAHDAGISFGARHDSLVRSFIASMATKRFAILTGLSGSGKTQLAIRFGEWLGSERMLVVPVRPDWTGSEFLFGFEDALQPTEGGRRAWQVPEPLRFILQAAGDKGRSYLLVLDEMNLAHVERYFADVLSGMESGQPCLPNLDRGRDGAWRLRVGTNEKIPLPDNLFVIGTVNIDETTYMFSPKVLDRANTFEFRVASSDLESGRRSPSKCTPGPRSLVNAFSAIARDRNWHVDHPAESREQFAEQLRALHRLLSEYGFEFGHRTFFEAERFLSLLSAAGETTAEAALDRQVLQKILPRIHGARRRVEPLLVRLGQFCYDPSIPLSDSEQVATAIFDPCAPLEGVPQLPIAFDKIRRMTALVRANQFVSFTE